MTRFACITAIGLAISGCATATVVDDGGDGGETGTGASGPGSASSGSGTGSSVSTSVSGSTSAASTSASSSSGGTMCGNGDLDAGEVCDDGNTTGGDGCSAACDSDESCGNEIIDGAAGEACDDGNTTGGDGCSAQCTLEACGNMIVDVGETCDDGNMVDGDGCDASCQSEGCVINGALFPMSIPGSLYGLGQFAFDGGCDILVVHGQPKNLVRIDGAIGTQSVVATIGGVGTYLIGVTWRPADGMAYVTTDQGEIYSVGSGGTSTLVYDHADIVEALAVAPPTFGTYAGQIIGSTFGGQIFALDPAGPTVSTVASVAGNVSGIAFAPDGTLYIAPDSGQISTVSPSGTVTLVGSAGFSPEGIAVDLAGNRVFLASSSSDQLYSLSLGGGSPVSLGSFDFDDGYFVTGMLFDGTTLIMGTGEVSMSVQDVVP